MKKKKKRTTRKLGAINSLSVAKAVEFYLENETRKRKSRITQVQESLWLRRMIEFLETYRSMQVLGSVKLLKDIRPLHLEMFQTYLFRSNNRYLKYRPAGKGGRRKLKASSVNRMFNCYRHFFRRCLAWGFIDEDPCEPIKNLTETLNIRKPWSEREFANVLLQAPPWFQHILIFAKYTGARAGAISELNWSDIDLERRVVRLKTRKGGAGRLKVYEVPIFQELFYVLNERLETSPDRRPRSPVFLNRQNKRISATHISRETGRLLKKAGLEDQGLGIHGLRHSLASKLHVSGASTETIRIILGHANTKTTERYLHTEIKSLDEAITRAFKAS